MSIFPTAERYRLPARILHWLVALAIPFQFYLGWASELAVDRESGWRLLILHFELGLVVAALMLLRLAWRIVHGAPAPLADERRWHRRLAACVHWTMYALLLLLPASGYVIWVWMEASMDVFGLFTLPRLFTPPGEDETGRAIAWYVHYWGGWMLAGLAALHVSTALWHQFVRRDGLIARRML